MCVRKRGGIEEEREGGRLRGKREKGTRKESEGGGEGVCVCE